MAVPEKMQEKRSIQDEFVMDEDKISSTVFGMAQRNPFLAVGVLGFLTSLGIGAYKFKTNKRNYPTSLFLIQLRVAAQSAVVGTLAIGMAYNMVNHFVLKNDDHK